MKDGRHYFIQIACACVCVCGGGKHDGFLKGWSHRSAVTMVTGLSGPQGIKQGEEDGAAAAGGKRGRQKELWGAGLASVSHDKRRWKFGPLSAKMENE